MLKKLIKQQIDKQFNQKLEEKLFKVSQKIKKAKADKVQLEQQYEQLQKQSPNISKEIKELYNETISKYQKLEQPFYLILQYPNYQEIGWRANISIHEKEIRWYQGHSRDIETLPNPHNNYINHSKVSVVDDESDKLEIELFNWPTVGIKCRYGSKIEVINSHDQEETYYRFCMPEKIRQAFKQYLPTFKDIIEQEDNFETLNQALNNIEELLINAEHLIKTMQQEIDFSKQQKELHPEEQMDKDWEKYIELKLQV